MICKNCGAEIDDTLLLCPYCNTENEAVASEEHRDEVNFILDQPDCVFFDGGLSCFVIVGVCDFENSGRPVCESYGEETYANKAKTLLEPDLTEKGAVQ